MAQTTLTTTNLAGTRYLLYLPVWTTQQLEQLGAGPQTALRSTSEAGTEYGHHPAVLAEQAGRGEQASCCADEQGFPRSWFNTIALTRTNSFPVDAFSIPRPELPAFPDACIGSFLRYLVASGTCQTTKDVEFIDKVNAANNWTWHGELAATLTYSGPRSTTDIYPVNGTASGLYTDSLGPTPESFTFSNAEIRFPVGSFGPGEPSGAFYPTGSARTHASLVANMIGAGAIASGVDLSWNAKWNLFEVGAEGSPFDPTYHTDPPSLAGPIGATADSGSFTGNPTWGNGSFTRSFQVSTRGDWTYSFTYTHTLIDETAAYKQTVTRTATWTLAGSTEFDPDCRPAAVTVSAGCEGCGGQGLEVAPA